MDPPGSWLFCGSAEVGASQQRSLCSSLHPRQRPRSRSLPGNGTIVMVATISTRGLLPCPDRTGGEWLLVPLCHCSSVSMCSVPLLPKQPWKAKLHNGLAGWPRITLKSDRPAGNKQSRGGGRPLFVWIHPTGRAVGLTGSLGGGPCRFCCCCCCCYILALLLPLPASVISSVGGSSLHPLQPSWRCLDQRNKPRINPWAQ